MEEITSNLLDNPYHIPKDLLMTFIQNFMRKSNNTSKKSADSTSRAQPTQHTDYENVNIGNSFLKHVTDDVEQHKQNILSVLWVGCLPYLFPDEEIPVAVVITTINIFLFRVFSTSEDDTLPNKQQAFDSMTLLEEAMHCFYSFPIKSLREVVVGLFDQGIRLEVQEEGARGTFVLLTRDANKTGQFLDVLTSLVDVKTGRDVAEASDHKVNVVYPDESKINAFKAQLEEQEIASFDARENLISYCIVYQARENPSRKDDFDEKCSYYLRSLILTNKRIFLCDEDYVHWPLPSFIHSAPFTPQWVVDDLNHVEGVVGIDLWEDQKQTLRGNYGLSLTFERNSSPQNEEEDDEDEVWEISFQCATEREQLVRSLASIWKNSFGQDLKVTKSNRLRSTKDQLSTTTSHQHVRGHAKKPSGNIAIPSNQSVESPEMFVSIDRTRLNELFKNKIAQGEEDECGVQYVACLGCKPYTFPDVEVKVAVLLSKHKIYLICSAKDRKYIQANIQFEDHEASSSLYVTSIEISELQQVVVGLFDQCLRLETGFPEATFVLVTRDFDRTNEFIQRLSQAILSLPKKMNVLEDGSNSEEVSRENAAQIFQMFKKEDESSKSYYPKSEFIHPNSSIKFVYPSDELLQKLRIKIKDYISLMDLFPMDNEFGVLLYALIFQKENDVETPYTFVASETFVCLINEEHASYPLPLFVKELPDKSQYEISDVRLISSLLRVEFNDFHSGEVTLIFNACAVDPTKYGDRFKMGSVEDDVCYVTDVNAMTSQSEKKSQQDEGVDEKLLKWRLVAHSYAEREKIFDVLSKMWSNIFPGKTLPVIRAKQ